MELLFVWIRRYKGIKEIGLNLSNQFRFHYDVIENQINITKSENFIHQFFGDNITNLTAIIGENGTGKTTALRYIIEYLSGGIHNHEDNESVIFFKVGELINYYSSNDIKIKTTGISIKKVTSTEKIRSSAITIFASNTFDPTSYYAQDYLGGQLGETKNLSTWFLLYSDYQNRTGEDAFRRNLTYEQRFAAFAAQEFIRMVRLLRWLNIQEAKGRPFPVTIPPYLNLKLFFNENEEYSEELTSLSRQLSEYFPITRSNKNRFLFQAFLASVHHFMNEIKFISGPDVISETYKNLPSKIQEYIKKKKYDGFESSIVPEIANIFKYILEDENFEMILNERLDKMHAFLHKLDEFVNKRNIRFSKDGKSIAVELSKANKSALEELIEEYYKTDKISGYADFYFSHVPEGESTISSGEYAMLILFARLNSIKIDYRKPLIILIDEAELALHPQWQKEFIYHFTDFITERFSSHKVQIIITAHSPFILSDLPSNCVVLLKKGGDKTLVIDSLENKQETFGANIHELFTDSFFLQNGLMGEFARNKIEHLIIELNEAQHIPLDLYENHFKKRISIIGEPFIRAKLFEIVANKSDLTVIDEIIEQRNSEIENLRQIKARKENDKN